MRHGAAKRHPFRAVSATHDLWFDETQRELAVGTPLVLTECTTPFSSQAIVRSDSVTIKTAPFSSLGPRQVVTV